jgi:adenosylcobalamin-dependent ribonucleoside-triphosphate reductase
MSEARTFKLSSSFLEEFENKQPDWGPLGYITYARTYSRVKEDQTSEEFWETCKRVVEGCYNIQKKHCHRLGLFWDNIKAQKSAQEMFIRMWEFKWLPPGRGLWMMGADHVEKTGGGCLNNCAMVSSESINVDFAEPFCWAMDMLMLGVGVGFDAKGAGLVKIQEPKQNDDVFLVKDSREGWVSLLYRILDSYTGRGGLPAGIDYSDVRPAGSPIRGFGGTASGPGPLDDLVTSVKEVLTPLIGEKITSTAIVDIFNLIGRCVVAGNVRRSAELALGEADDEEFLSLKDPSINQDKLYKFRWASNNTVFAKVGMDYSKVANLTAKNGEPGFLWLENAKAFSRMGRPADDKDRRVVGLNPCGEMTLESMELCNLVETFPSRHESYADFEKTLKYAYLYAKTVTLIPTHSEKTNQIMLRNRRIGTSMSGIVQAMQKHGRREFFNWCDSGYLFLKELDKIYSDWLCVRESIKITTVKPSGSVSLLPQVTPGIHFPHSEYYIRRIRFQSNSALVDKLRNTGYKVEEDKYSPNTVVVEFPVKEEFFDRAKKDVSMWEQLELAAQMQSYWSDNAVSATITFSGAEAENIKHALELYETRLKSVSFLPMKDHGYVQAPYEAITKQEYDSMVAKITPITHNGNIKRDMEDRFCDGEACMIN